MSEDTINNVFSPVFLNGLLDEGKYRNPILKKKKKKEGETQHYKRESNRFSNHSTLVRPPKNKSLIMILTIELEVSNRKKVWKLVMDEL